MSEQTKYGFRMGAAEVIRVVEDKGYAIIAIQTKHKRIDVYVTPAGRKITVVEAPVVPGLGD